MTQRLALLVGLLAACGGTYSTETVIESVTPSYGPLSGGTRVVITGSGFLRAGAPPNRVLVGGIEAPLAAAIDDARLEVQIPPGEVPGDVPIIVLNRNGSTVVDGLFRYSEEPTIDSATPARVLYNESTRITVTGTGFLDEDAGPPTVLINGEPAIDVEVESDTTLSFMPRPAPAMATGDIEITNARGTVRLDNAYRVVPGTAPGLLLFPSWRAGDFGTTFAYYYDPAADLVVHIPRVAPIHSDDEHYRAVIRDSQDEYWAILHDNRLGRIDFRTQRVIEPVALHESQWVNVIASVGETMYALSRNGRAFGSFDVATGTFAPISQTPTASGRSLASDGTTLYLIDPSGISTINPATGVRGPVAAVAPVPANNHWGELRWLDGTLYALGGKTSFIREIMTVNPATGAATIVETLPPTTSIGAVEVFLP